MVLDVNVNQIAGMFTFITLSKRIWIKVSKPTQAQSLKLYGHSGEGRREKPGDVTQVEKLMATFNCALQKLRIEYQSLTEANITSVSK